MRSLRGTGQHYGLIAIIFHWVMAVLVVGMLAVGLYMDGLPNSLEKLQWYGWHKSFGAVVLTLVALRLLWRFTNRIPPLPEVIPSWQKGLAHLGHYGLYALLFAMPLSGWMMSSAAGVPVSVFGWFTLPDIVSASPSLKKTMAWTHGVLAFVLIAMILGHIGAVVFHYLHQRVNLVSRMSLWQ